MSDQYLNIITSQHRQQPKYIAMVSAFLRKINDAKVLLDAWDLHFGLNESFGAQLDVIGEIVGRKRKLDFQPVGYSAVLDDENYRLVIKAKILQNQWDGTNQSIKTLFNSVFPDKTLVIQDNQDMTMKATIIGLENELHKQLLNHGYIIPKPSGVGLEVSIITNKIFAFDRSDQSFGGWDEGEWL